MRAWKRRFLLRRRCRQRRGTFGDGLHFSIRLKALRNPNRRNLKLAVRDSRIDERARVKGVIDFRRRGIGVRGLTGKAKHVVQRHDGHGTQT